MSEKNVPNVRFKGFSESWEQRQLGKIVDERKERSSQGELLSVTMHDGIKKSSTLGKKDNSSDNKSNYKVVCQGDIAYNSMRMWQGASGLSMFNGIVSPAYTVLKIGTSIDGSFLSYLFKRSEMIWMFRTHSQGLTSDTWNLKYPALSKIKIEYPILNEQIRISTFLKNFDQLIASNQRKLDQLKEVKKLLMQKIFDQEWRFEGFTDPWEERKLGDISYKVKEKNKTGEFTETLTNSAEYGIINQRDFFDKDISNAKNLTGYYVVKNDDFVYNPRISNFAPVGPIKRNKLGRTGVMSPLYYVFRTHDIDKNYFEKYFDTVYWHRFMELNGDSGARADRFAIKDSVFVEMPIPYPTMDEQQKIGSFFKQIDDTIALHQQKLDQLKEMKKWFMQNMFV